MKTQILKNTLDYNPTTGVFHWINSQGSKKAGSIAGSLDPTGCIYIKIDRVNCLAHRLAWQYVTGVEPSMDVIHSDGNRSNNAFSNLEHVSTKEVTRRSKAPSHSMFEIRGVTWRKRLKRFHARIGANGNDIHLGYFKNIDAAIAARKAGEIKYWNKESAQCEKNTRIDSLNKTLSLLITRQNSRGSTIDLDYEIECVKATIKRHDEAIAKNEQYLHGGNIND